VQVVMAGGHKVRVIKHIGSSKDPQKIASLKVVANDWIERHSPQPGLFKKEETQSLVLADNLVLVSTVPALVHQLCLKDLSLLGFDQVVDRVVLDLVFIRLVEPASKKASVELLATRFGLKHSLRTVNRRLTQITGKKSAIEKKAVEYAKTNLGFNFSIVFYDVTTLYFETFKSDESGKGARQPGFSKDNKHQQPQIVIGLVVTQEGFPLGFRVFAGNKFEGKTMIPVLKQLQAKHQIKTLTVVADAAMISQDNIRLLEESNLGYIVGARMGNLGLKLIDQVSSQLNQQDGNAMRLKTVKGWLICQFLKKRYHKDKSDTKKQVAKAKAGLKDKSKSGRRLKFIRCQKGSPQLSFNKKLFEKTQKLWGIKGYYTNQDHLIDQEIINQYHNLWQVEKSFRMSKSDLKARPIYHYKTPHIVAHLIICFMALCLAKHWEFKTKLSIKKIITLLGNIHDAKIKDKLTKQTITLRRELTPEEKLIVEKLS
jgi:transposase